jgi:DNA-binding transcriptional ArsR family regulator
MAAIDAGLVRDTQCPGAVSGETWFKAVDRLREHGFEVPEFDPSTGSDAEHTAILPPAIRDLSSATEGFDWRHAAEQRDGGLTVDEARERTTEAIADAYGSGDRVLIEALPTMGKSYGAIKAAADTGEPITVLTGRGHKEQYEQFKQWCDEHGLSYYQLPSFARHCETANGDHGQEWADTVNQWYRRGATPKMIHKAAEDVLGESLPCQCDAQCTYTRKWDFEPDEVDVLIGHYSHAHRADKVVNSRTVVFDEFPSAYETEVGPELQGAVSYWVSTTPAIPFDSWTDLLENRDDEERRGEALLWFEEAGLEADEGHVFDDAKAHAAAPLAVYALLTGDDLGNGFESADLGNVGTAAFDRDRGSVTILRPPSLQYASAVVGLDGTPTKDMWELSLGERLNHRPVLQPEERAEYLRDALNLNLIRTTEFVKPYNSPDHVNAEADAALLEAIAENHNERPGLIMTTTAEGEHESAGALDYLADTKDYGNVLGSNEFKAKRVGAVIGSNHYGDDYLKKWGAYNGTAVERNDEKGAELSYGTFGDKIHRHMQKHDTLQAAMRFGRDAGGAVVYVHTDTLPEWVPIADEGRVVRTWSDGLRGVIDAVEDLGSATTAEVAGHDAVDIGERTVLEHLETLREHGVLSREQDPDDGRRVVWSDDELHRVGDHGEVELGDLDFSDLTDDEVHEIARSTIYTWNLVNFANDSAGRREQPSSMRSGGGDPAGSEGDPPPEWFQAGD